MFVFIALPLMVKINFYFTARKSWDEGRVVIYSG